MKKIATLGIVAVAGFSLAACGNNSTKSSSNSSSSEAVSGPMTKIGQYQKATSDTPKATLVAINKMNKTQKVDQAAFKFTNAKSIKKVATTNNQLDFDKSNFGTSLSKTYYVYQLSYTLQNNSNKKIHSNGAELILPDGTQVSSNSGAMDSLVGEDIQSHAKKTGYIQAKITKSDTNKLTKFKFVTPELFDDDSTVNIDQTTVSFE